MCTVVSYTVKLQILQNRVHKEDMLSSGLEYLSFH